MAKTTYTSKERDQMLDRAMSKSLKNQNLDMADSLSNVNLVYLNPAQATVYNFGARTTTVEAGRGTGKTDGLISPYMIRCTQSTPRGTGLFLGNSIKQLFTKTVPNTIAAIERITGLREGVHFFRGHAPAKCGFAEPYVKPRIWENCIHFWNGTVWYMISTATKAASNGMNVCFITADEARFLPKNQVLGEILPCLRGLSVDTTHPGYDEKLNPFYKSLFMVSDAPLTKRQGWLRERKDAQTYDINKKIAEMIAEANVCPEIVSAPKFQKQLNRLRCQANIYMRFSTIENIDILGEEFIRSMKRELTPTMFDISIRNVEKERINDGYYCNLNIDDVHGYTNGDDEQMEAACKAYNSRTITQVYSGGRTLRVENESINLDALRKADNCVLDTDIIPGEPLRIALDYNSLINAIVIGQTPSRRDTSILRILNSMVNIKASRLEGLMAKVHKYYEPHQATCRDIIFYYDSTAKQGAAYASERFDETRYYNIVRNALKRKGWNVIEVPMGRPMSHNKKYEFLNGCLAGTQRPYIRINRENNEDLIASMENAGVIEGRNGFEKDKSKEKYRISVDCADPETELAQRTDLSDAFDTLVIGVRYYGVGRMIGVGMPIVS